MDLNFNSTYIVPYCTTKQIPIEAPIFAVGGSQREDARKKVPPECALSAEADLLRMQRETSPAAWPW